MQTWLHTLERRLFVDSRSMPGPLGFAVRLLRFPAALLRDWLSGESWQQGQVILSWDDVLSGAAVPDDGRNVVIHEFAHQLDQETGHANGAPFLGGREQYRTWAQTMNAEFEGLRAQLAQGAQSLIDPYAATDPAEFFAVLSELFFELPAPLAIAHPALYEELLRYYRVDPRAW